MYRLNINEVTPTNPENKNIMCVYRELVVHVGVDSIKVSVTTLAQT